MTNMGGFQKLVVEWLNQWMVWFHIRYLMQLIQLHHDDCEFLYLRHSRNTGGPHNWGEKPTSTHSHLALVLGGEKRTVWILSLVKWFWRSLQYLCSSADQQLYSNIITTTPWGQDNMLPHFQLMELKVLFEISHGARWVYLCLNWSTLKSARFLFFIFVRLLKHFIIVPSLWSHA